MLALDTLGLLGDSIAWGVGFETLSCAPQIRALGSFISYASGFPLLVVYSIYLLSFINEDRHELRRYAVLVGGLCADGFLLVIIAQITALNKHNPWHLSDYPWFFFFFLALPIVLTGGIILTFRKMLTNRKAITFLSYEVLVAATVVFDLAAGDITLAYIAAGYALLQIYVSVQIEYEKQQEERLMQQRISIMLSQIQPHFLYNVLTGIRALCRIDPEKAERALTDFTIYLRGNLNSIKNSSCIPFAQEMEHIRHYIELETMRFGEDLQVDIDTPVTHFELPPLTLEPIVENAVRHGVMQREKGGHIRIKTAEDGGDFLITVTDDGVGFDPETIDWTGGEHVGLQNARERLRSICGGELKIRSAPGEGTVATVVIPKKFAERLALEDREDAARRLA